MVPLESAARNVARVILGSPVIAVQHTWRNRYVERSNQEVCELSKSRPQVAADGSGRETQTRLDGMGPLVLRTYRVDVTDSDLSAAQLISALKDGPNDFSPRHIAGFRRFDGEPVSGMCAGDEFMVELPGPWSGPVRVDHEDSTSFVLATLDGHMEAGQIEFFATDTDAATENDRIRFEIRSWARAGDRLFEFLHLDVPIGKEAQTAMWVHTCDRAVAVSRGRRDGPIRVDTETLVNSAL